MKQATVLRKTLPYGKFKYELVTGLSRNQVISKKYDLDKSIWKGRLLKHTTPIIAADGKSRSWRSDKQIRINVEKFESFLKSNLIGKSKIKLNFKRFSILLEDQNDIIAIISRYTQVPFSKFITYEEITID